MCVGLDRLSICFVMGCSQYNISYFTYKTVLYYKLILSQG